MIVRHGANGARASDPLVQLDDAGLRGRRRPPADAGHVRGGRTRRRPTGLSRSPSGAERRSPWPGRTGCAPGRWGRGWFKRSTARAWWGSRVTGRWLWPASGARTGRRDLAAETTRRLTLDHCDTGFFSGDGTTFLCDTTLIDRRSQTMIWPPHSRTTTRNWLRGMGTAPCAYGTSRRDSCWRRSRA